jgi:hypothetical protein
MNDSSAQSSPKWLRAGSPRAEKWTATALAVAIAVGAIAVGGGCGHQDAITVDPAYAADIDALCNSLERSGADKLQGNDRKVVSAMWLGKNLTSADARTFLVKIQPLVGDAKAQALDAEAKRVGLAACPLAGVWRAPAPGSGS